MSYKDLITSNIKKLRLRLGLTQDKFSEKAGLSSEGYRKLEASKYAPTPATVDKICEAYNITPFELLIPNSEQDDDIINEISSKLKLCSDDDLIRINQIIDIIRH